MSFGSSIYDAGPVGGEPFFGKRITPDPSEQYIATGPGRFTPKIPQIITSEYDDLTRNFGFRVLDAMLTDPAVKSTFMSLKLSILSGPLRVQPAVRPKGYRDGQAFNVDDTKGKLTPQEKRSIEIAEFCKRDIKRNRRVHFKSVLMQLLDKMVHGVKLAEKTREEVEFGPDKGKLGLSTLNIKPWWAWKFVVDAYMVPQYILTWLPPEVEKAPYTGGYVLVPIDKFVNSVWMPTDGDPRGTSILRAAYDWWNLKRQCMPFYYQHLRRFGSPSLDGVTSPTDVTNRFPIDPNTGLEITTQPQVSPAMRFTQALIAFQNNAVIIRPPGSELNVIEPRSDGEAFLKAFDMFDRAICLAIGLQARSSLEAKHGSKADSETAQDTRGLITEYCKEDLGEDIENQIFYESVLLNFGPDDAEEFTPCMNVGKVEQQDKATMWTAAAGLGLTIGPSQIPELCAMIDLPEPDVEADQQAAMDQMKQQADLAAQMKPPQAGGPGKKPPSNVAGGKKTAKPPSPGGQKPKAKPSNAKTQTTDDRVM